MAMPEGFAEHMQHWLGSEWLALADALAEPAWRGVRLLRWQTAATSAAGPHPTASGQESAHPTADLALATPLPPLPAAVQAWLADPVPWSPACYYLPTDAPLGRWFYHELGAYYLQEPSAMAPATALAAQPGEWVLDLCAAPGGKTTALGWHMQGQGVLVANDIHPQRARVLAENLERCGVPAAVLQENVERLAAAWPGVFDAVLVDAPCSGEGMFRKDPVAVQAWHPLAPERCADRQRHILSHALRLVRPGGRLVYSTCTFNPLENEQVIAWALQHFAVELLPLPDWPGWDSGRPDWAGARELPELTRTRRLWPHRGRGEGHFVALLRVLSTPATLAATSPPFKPEPQAQRRLTGHRSHRAKPRQTRSGPALPWSDWLAAAPPAAWRTPVQLGQTWYANHLPASAAGLRVLRPGLPLAWPGRDRPVPHHALAMALAAGCAQQALHLHPEQAVRYIQGEPLPPAPRPGWVWLHVDGLPVGWGHSNRDRLNNHYPKGLRRLTSSPASDLPTGE
ncbi:MAG: RNA methyltransferase [Alicyclobacillus shizuokensis]|nr:RNA methyltransferase [Alicyclobacillus shizuokensis]